MPSRHKSRCRSNRRSTKKRTYRSSSNFNFLELAAVSHKDLNVQIERINQLETALNEQKKALEEQNDALKYALNYVSNLHRHTIQGKPHLLAANDRHLAERYQQ